jgi:hypothetical protein
LSVCVYLVLRARGITGLTVSRTTLPQTTMLSQQSTLAVFVVRGIDPVLSPICEMSCFNMTLPTKGPTCLLLLCSYATGITQSGLNKLNLKTSPK